MAGVGGLPTGTALMDLLITGTGGAAGPGGGLAGPLGTAGTAGVPQAISHLSESLKVEVNVFARSNLLAEYVPCFLQCTF